MAEKARNLSTSVNGWQALVGFGDHTYFKGDYFLKAAAATVGYLANDAEEASYRCVGLPFWRTKIASRIASYPWSNLPMYLSAHSLAT